MLVRIAPSQRITPSLLHRFTPSEQITPSLLHLFTPPPLAAQLLHHFTPSEQIAFSYTILPIAAHSYMAISFRGVTPQNSSHCSPLQPALTCQFQSGGLFLKIPPIAAHSYMAISVRGNS